MNESFVCEYKVDPNPGMTDRVIGILALTGVVAITGAVLYGAGRIWYRINEKIFDKVGNKIFKGGKEESRNHVDLQLSN